MIGFVELEPLEPLEPRITTPLTSAQSCTLYKAILASTQRYVIKLSNERCPPPIQSTIAK